MPIAFFSPKILSLTVFSLLFCLVFYFWFVDVFTIKTVRIENKYVDDSVKSYLHTDTHALEAALADLTVGNLLLLNSAAIREAVLQFPWIKAVEVERQFPDTVVIRLAEHQALAQWRAGGLVSSEGKFFPANAVDMQLPSFYGNSEDIMSIVENYRLLQALFAEQDLRIAELGYNAYRAWQVRLTNRIQLVLGSQFDLTKIQRFLTIYPRIMADTLQVQQQPAQNSPLAWQLLFDLRYTNGIAVQLSQAK